MDSLPPIRSTGDTIVRVGHADAVNNSTYVLRKSLSKATVTSIAKKAIKSGAGPGYIFWLGIVTAAGIMWDAQDDRFEKGEQFPGTWQCDTSIERNEGCVNMTSSQASAFNLNKFQTGSNGSIFTYSITECQTVDATHFRCYFQAVRNSTGQVEPTSSGWQTYVLASANYPTGYSPLPVTDDELNQFWNNYAGPNPLGDAFRNPNGQPVPEVATGGGPEPLTQQQIDALRDLLANGLGLSSCVGDPVVVELCKLGKAVGVDGVPDPQDIPGEVTDPDAEGGGGTEVDPTADDQISGGEDCAAPPTCSGDPIACAHTIQTWRLRCPAPQTEEAMRAGITDAGVGADLTFPTGDTLAVGAGDFDDDGFLGGRSCPIPDGFDMGEFGAIGFDNQQPCALLNALAAMVLVAGYLTAARIAFGP